MKMKTLFLFFFYLIGGILFAQHKKSVELNFSVNMYNHKRVSPIEFGHQNISSFGWGAEGKINRHLRKSKINLSVFAGLHFLQLPVWYMRNDAFRPTPFIKTEMFSEN